MHQKMHVKALALYLLAWITAAYKPLNSSDMKPDADGGSASSIVLPIIGNVYPKGYYAVNVSIGNPPKYFLLDVDTGSDLTWARCFDNRTDPYDLNGRGTAVLCSDFACQSLEYVSTNCMSTQRCLYKVDYDDGGSSAGILASDTFSFSSSYGALVFGCVAPGENKDPIHQPFNDGVLGLGKGGAAILRQLRNMGAIQNIFGHCFNGQGQDGGLLYFGRDVLSIPGTVWKETSNFDDKHYNLGKADILLDGHITNISDLEITLDSGNTYTYLNSEAYGAFLGLITNNLKGPLSVADGDGALPVCWKDVDHPIETIAQVASYFKTVALNFTDANNNNVQFEMLQESYLIINNQRNVCLGILNGTEFGLKDMNVIGAISMQRKLVIYDNERERVGWAAADTCNVKP